MCMFCRFCNIEDKTHISCVFGHFLVANMKEFKFSNNYALFSLYYYKEHIADGFLNSSCFVDGP